MTALIPDPIRCSYNFPGHTPHWGRVRRLRLSTTYERAERIISVVQQSATSCLVATQLGSVTALFNHQPSRLVAIWQLYPEAGRLYFSDGLIGVRHREHISGEARDAEYLFSVALSGFRTCEEITKDLDKLKAPMDGPT